jgi:hypothetical protein
VNAPGRRSTTGVADKSVTRAGDFNSLGAILRAAHGRDANSVNSVTRP